MIVKELDPAYPRDRLEKAGRAAEEQMAFYLRRAFKDDPKVHVFNGLRMIREGEVAQIDHLVLHKYGFVIVDSKSVTTEVRVDAHGAWARVFHGAEHGMRSPVNQARLQAELLYSVLDDHKSEVLGKVLGLQRRFDRFPMDVLVAISDEGVLKRKPDVAPEACKADQIVDRIDQLIGHYRRLASPFAPTLKVAISFAESHIDRITSLLIALHTPLQLQPEHAAPSPINRQRAGALAGATTTDAVDSAAQTWSASVCRRCGGAKLKLEYRFNFFLRCLDCDGSTPLVLSCPSCRTLHKSVQKGSAARSADGWLIRCRCCHTEIPIRATHCSPAIATT